MNRIINEDTQIIINEKIRWEKLKNTTFLITGASGMIGSYLVYTLLKLNEEKDMNIKIYTLVRNPKKLSVEIKNSEYVNVITQDVCNKININGKVDYVIHTAGQASPALMKKDPVGTIGANTVGTYNTLELAREKNALGYLFISSREIYGQPFPHQEKFSENDYGLVDPLNPRSCYPEGKKASETMCVSYNQQYKLNTKIARLAHTYGPGMSIYDGRVQADFLKNIIHNENIVLKSDGSSIRTYTYIRDAIIAMFYILLESDDIVYNIGDENSKVSIKQLAEVLVSLRPEKNLSLVFDIPKSEKNSGCAPFTLGILDTQKIRKLGWSPKLSVKDGFMRTIEYLEIEKNKINK